MEPQLIESLDNLINGYRLDLELQSKSHRTISSYVNSVRYLSPMMEELGLDFISIEVVGLQRLLSRIKQTGVKHSRIGNLFSGFNSFIDFLQFTKRRIDNPVPPFRKRYLQRYKGSIQKVPRLTPTLQQMREIIYSSNTEMEKAIHLLLAKTGIRRMSLLALKVSDIDLVKKTIRLSDEAKVASLILPIDFETVNQIENWLHERQFETNLSEEALFVNSRGTALAKNMLATIVREAGIRVGIHDSDAPRDAIDRRFSPHCYRHFMTTMMRRNGCPERIIAYLRGDAEKSIRDHYDHVDFQEVDHHYNAHIWRLN